MPPSGDAQETEHESLCLWNQLSKSRSTSQSRVPAAAIGLLLLTYGAILRRSGRTARTFRCCSRNAVEGSHPPDAGSIDDPDARRANPIQCIAESLAFDSPAPPAAGQSPGRKDLAASRRSTANLQTSDCASLSPCRQGRRGLGAFSQRTGRRSAPVPGHELPRKSGVVQCRAAYRETPAQPGVCPCSELLAATLARALG